MKKSILVAVNDSASSRHALDYLSELAVCQAEVHLTLLHVFRKPSASEELMGPNYMRQQQERYMRLLEDARDTLSARGIAPGDIELKLVTTPYATVTDGIIDEFNKMHYGMVVLGRKRMSKAEEFVLGDVGVKLVRALEGVAILVVKS
ncbi:MAG: universal stress protein [Pseudomonadota bacterium]